MRLTPACLIFLKSGGCFPMWSTVHCLRPIRSILAINKCKTTVEMYSSNKRSSLLWRKKFNNLGADCFQMEGFCIHKGKKTSNYDQSAAHFCRQVAALVQDKLCNFYLVKNHKIANNSKVAEARE
jgi:hypothetical protein